MYRQAIYNVIALSQQISKTTTTAATTLLLEDKLFRIYDDDA